MTNKTALTPDSAAEKLGFERTVAGSAAAQVAFAFSAAALIFLLSLHALSPEFSPASRMVSEYALGGYGWVLSLMFISWAIGTWALAFALRRKVRTTAGKTGLIFLILAGFGEAMASLYDVTHGLHGVAALIGIPSLPIGAMLVSYGLARGPERSASTRPVVWTANLTWISLLLMTSAMGVMFSGLAKTGGQMTPDVIAVGGWANRLLILAYCAWAITASWQLISSQKRAPQ